jgi:hypothetical protein
VDTTAVSEPAKNASKLRDATKRTMNKATDCASVEAFAAAPDDVKNAVQRPKNRSTHRRKEDDDEDVGGEMR